MPCLICDLRPGAEGLLHEYHALHATGEAVALFWPAVLETPGPRAASAAALLEDFENERIAYVAEAELPPWLPLDEFHRILLITEHTSLAPAELRLAKLLLARGAEAVEVLTPAAAADLAQSWASGRRTGSRVLHP